MTVRDILDNFRVLVNRSGYIREMPLGPQNSDAILSALEAAGYAIVPKEPTEAMRIAALCTHLPEFVGDYPLYEKCWRAMLAAARETP